MDLPPGEYATILADPPWLFENRTGKVAPEHKRLYRYHTMTNDEIIALPVSTITAPKAHLYLWVPNALIELGLKVMAAWGFTYKTNLVWYKVRQDGGPDRRGVGFYFRNVTELVLFGVKGHMRTLDPARSMPNIVISRKREHSRKPDQLYDIIEKCSPAPHLELFCRVPRPGWTCWGDESEHYEPRKSIYTASHSERPGFELYTEDGVRIFEDGSQYDSAEDGVDTGGARTTE